MNAGMKQPVVPSDPKSGAYGVRTLRTLRADKSGSVRLQKKVELTYNYFLEEVDPVIGELITYLLCEQPIDVPGAMLQHLQKQKLDAVKALKRKEKKSTEEAKAEAEAEQLEKVQAQDEEDAKNKRNEKRSKKEKKIFLAVSIGPVVSKLVNRIANTRPKKVVEFLCDELTSMIYGNDDEEPKEIETDDRFEQYAGQNGPSLEEVQREMDKAAIVPIETPETQNLVSGNQEVTQIDQTDQAKSTEPELVAEIIDNKEVVVEKVKEEVKEVRNLQFAVIGMDGAGKTSLINMLQGRGNTVPKPTIGFKPTALMLGEELQIRLYVISED